MTATLAWVSGVLVVEEATGQDLEVADVFVLRADAEQHGVLGDAGAHGDAVVDLQHGRAGGDVREPGRGRRSYLRGS